MRDFCLKFEDQNEAIAALLAAGFLQDEFGVIYHDKVSIDMIGTIITTTFEDDVPVYENEPGYHINLRVVDENVDVTSLTPFFVYPETPSRVWA